jgi:hypothetical protein
VLETTCPVPQNQTLAPVDLSRYLPNWETIDLSAPQLDLSEEFARFFESPSRDKLRNLLQHRTGEYDHLDFKREWPERSELARDILGLANTGNGCLVIGVSEQGDGTLDVHGLDTLSDKTDVKTSVSKYLPDVVSFEIHDFEYNDSDYTTLKGKKFQVLLTAYVAEAIPVLSIAEGSNVKRHQIYVRRDGATTIATHDQVQQLIASRLEAAQASPVAQELSSHLAQLHELYEHSLPDFAYGLFDSFGPMANQKGFYSFLSRMIAKKEALIASLLSQHDGK